MIRSELLPLGCENSVVWQADTTRITQSRYKFLASKDRMNSEASNPISSHEIPYHIAKENLEKSYTTKDQKLPL